jgi:hypothetical protein
VKKLISFEELFLALLCVFLFRDLDYPWWWFAAFFFAPDISMIGYAAGPRLGAIVYNFVHHKALAITLYIVGAILSNHPLQFTGLILLAHSSIDRVLGYGLKYLDSFQHTHLGMIGGRSTNTSQN